MVFSSQLFLFYFLPLSLCVYYLLAGASQRLRNLWLVLTGYVFYGWAEPRFILLMFATTSFDWLLSLVVSRGRWRFWQAARGSVVGEEGASVRRAALTLSVVSNLCALGFFKYFHFGVDSWNRLANGLGFSSASIETTLQVVLPLGISFYTFQALSYIVDVYRGEAEAMENFIDFSCFVSMFPHLVAGPILKFSFLAEQLRHRTLSVEKFTRGVAFFLMGLSKKVLLANPCGRFADTVFESAVRGVAEAWGGAVAYALQIYFDFSGYSDMAIGLGLMFGFVFARNFNSPYLAVSLSDFWRRWHISLSSWLRDYLYIPLGGNRRGVVRTYANLFGTMLVGGLWHGASWNFVLWGALHGGGLVVERACTRNAPGFRPPLWAGRLLTLLVVLAGWVFFRAQTLPQALDFLRAMAGLDGAGWGNRIVGGPLQQPYLLASLGVGLAVVAYGRQTWDWTQSLSLGKALCIVVLGGLAVVALLTQDYNPFIYFIF